MYEGDCSILAAWFCVYPHIRGILQQIDLRKRPSIVSFEPSGALKVRTTHRVQLPEASGLLSAAMTSSVMTSFHDVRFRSSARSVIHGADMAVDPG